MYAIRLPANDILQREINHLLTRPEGELPEKPITRYHDFQYQAKRWDLPSRMVAKIEWYRGQLFPLGRLCRDLSLPNLMAWCTSTTGVERQSIVFRMASMP